MAVRLFVGNMPYGATEADLRTHFSGVGEPSQIVIPVDRETGRPRGFAFVEYPRSRAGRGGGRTLQPAAVHGTDRCRSARRGLARNGRRAAGSVVRGRAVAGGGFSPRPPVPAGSHRAHPAPVDYPRPLAARRAASVQVAPPAPARRRPGATSVRRRRKATWENKDRGPKGPIKERYTGRLGGLYDDPDETVTPLTDFDDIASKRA